MNQYHIYEAIGHGKNSTVYKGRKKKTIEYFAIKSVDKCQKSKVLQEVRILHSLSHANVLKFYSWYETSAHLWLVLEYCVGGDLLTLLRQDSRLPEDSIHDLARDLVKALQFLHSKGIIYCDLKPSNILLDENGRMKLCDFGLSRRLSDISKNSLSQLPQGKRGTPCYMAPELFQEGGVHSYASDFWALGCVLYECYAGRPPFVGNEFTQLVNSILSDPTPPLPDNPSSSFVSLINCLLIKDPGERVQWSTLCEHSFWRTKMAHLPLPSQPAFSSMLQLFSKPCLSELNGDKPNKQKTTPEHCGRDSNGILRHDENSSISANKGIGTPIKNTQSARRANTKGPGKAEEKQKLAATTAKRVNLLRLSRVAKTNLQREKNKENYRQLLPKNPENDAEVKIENNDMELDFSENVEEDAQDESENASSVGEKTPMRTAGCEKPEKMDYNINQSDILSENDVSVHDDSKTFEQDTSSEHVELAAASPLVNLQRKAQRAKASGGNANDPVMSKSSDDLEVFWHPSDLSVRPIMPNRKGDKALEGMPSLPFDAVAAGDYVKLSPEQLKAHNHRILLSLTGNSPSLEKQNTIKYIEMLSGSAEAAEIVTNGPIMQMLVKMLRLTKTSVLRVQLATVIGLLIRHSTFIESDLAHSGIMSALADGLRDKQDKVRRFSMAALGELLYYISTQGENVKAGNLAEPPSKDNRSASGWQVPSSLIALMSSILRKGEDDATQLYALRTIENVCSQGGDWAARFTSHGQDVIGNLCYIYKATGKQESTRLTAGSCLVRVARFDPPSIPKIMEKLSFKDTASALIKGSSREQQISLNLLIMAMLASHMFINIGRHLMSLVEEKLLVPSLVSLIDQGSEVLRGKALLFVALLCRSSRRWLPQFFCGARLLPAVDRLAKEKDGYVVQCLGAFVQSVASSVPLLLETVSGDIHQMMSGKRHGQIASLSGRGNPKSSARLFPVVLHLLGSSSFKHRVVSSEILLQLANIVKLLESPFQGRDDFQITLLQILESVAEEPPIILNDPSIFTGHVLPSLAVLYKGNKDGDARFLCLKILFSLVVLFTYMGNTSLAEEQILNDLKMMSHTYFLPLYPTFIEDEDPIPMYAQKLLVMLIEYNFINVSDILHLKTITQCFDFLLGDLSSANVSDVKLCLALASAPDLETKILSQLHVVRKVGNLLEFVNAKQMEDFLEPTLALCKAFILRSIGGSKGIAYCREPSLLNDSTFNVSMAFDQQHSIKDISDFGSNVGVFLELIANPERQIADLASECMVLLIKASPREATTGLLTNLTKISGALESCQHNASGLQLLRVLHALAFSCRQFLSQAMILSISVPEIARVEAIVAGLKTSDILGVAGVASTLILELQRLPRGV